VDEAMEKKEREYRFDPFGPFELPLEAPTVIARGRLAALLEND
jgi:hypothetical protein